MNRLASINTLHYEAALCIGCGVCLDVCPHGVFDLDSRSETRVVRLVRPAACMECGACQKNCPVGALQVDSGTGCASAMIRAALSGKKEAKPT
jgi:ferredoxin